jgi:large subunit ribosomal protein L32
MRRSHDHIKAPALTRCTRCNHAVPPHHVCPNCGYYGEKPVVDLEGGRG